ncbi:G-protein coupled receptor 15 isoform X2 [Tympanuchus pallidicinctus]|uniref:G-protein coupled receptor 15 isoform X2 n=1 Tax=Tympanuchus pallidicinctus TaxID=109042 RepID=UPI0022872BCE|nr:G-protein coupled receptor 15 isoform X2 [Tympanuchus pallidicinctus]
MRTAGPEMDLIQLSPVTTVTFNYDDYYYEDSCQYEQLQHMTAFLPVLPVLYAAVFLVGILGNSILIVALVFKRRVQRLIDVFIINLAASDFIFLITLPFWVDKEASDGIWRVGSFLCKASSYIISVNMYCSILLLTCMSADRYLAIMYPSIARRVRTRSYSSGLCFCVWLLSCCLGIPTLLSRELNERYGKMYCTDKDVTESKQITSLMILILAFFFPLLSILTFYCSITKRLCVHYQRSGKHDKKLRKSIKIVFIVVAAFVISWVPFNLFKLMAILLGLQKLPDCFLDTVAQSHAQVPVSMGESQQWQHHLRHLGHSPEPLLIQFHRRGVHCKEEEALRVPVTGSQDHRGRDLSFQRWQGKNKARKGAKKK